MKFNVESSALLKELQKLSRKVMQKVFFQKFVNMFISKRKIHILPAALPNRNRPGAGQIPATPTFFDRFVSRFGSSSSDRVHGHSRHLRTSQPSPEGLSGVRRP